VKACHIETRNGIDVNLNVIDVIGCCENVPRQEIDQFKVIFVRCLSRLCPALLHPSIKAMGLFLQRAARSMSLPQANKLCHNAQVKRHAAEIKACK
jgi:hypothetical protein